MSNINNHDDYRNEEAATVINQNGLDKQIKHFHNLSSIGSDPRKEVNEFLED